MRSDLFISLIFNIQYLNPLNIVDYKWSIPNV